MDSVRKIPRLEDLPYISSPPIEFTYQSTATLSLGSYTWANTPSVLTPNRPLMTNALYYFRSITLAANIDELDFTSNISSIPQYNMYLKSNAKAILFREPIYMVKFFQNFEYRLTWLTRQQDDQLYAGFTGILLQGPGLIGKASITLTAIISAQEIVDDGYIKLFEQRYPNGSM